MYHYIGFNVPGQSFKSDLLIPLLNHVNTIVPSFICVCIYVHEVSPHIPFTVYIESPRIPFSVYLATPNNQFLVQIDTPHTQFSVQIEAFHIPFSMCKEAYYIPFLVYIEGSPIPMSSMLEPTISYSWSIKKLHTSHSVDLLRL